MIGVGPVDAVSNVSVTANRLNFVPRLRREHPGEELDSCLANLDKGWVARPRKNQWLTCNRH